MKLRLFQSILHRNGQKLYQQRLHRYLDLGQDCFDSQLERVLLLALGIVATGLIVTVLALYSRSLMGRL
jgi:hypothetical protein